jgi:hypothetical protein
LPETWAADWFGDIQTLINKETNPEQAVNDFLNGTLKTEPPEHQHGHKHQ